MRWPAYMNPMTIELYTALFMALFALLLAIASATSATLATGGFAWGLSNRHTDPVLPNWIIRFKRSHANTMENLPSFLGVVLIAHFMSVNDTITALAAAVFVVARVIFVVVYTAGITFMSLRTTSYFVGVGATFAIAWRIIA